jgi:hypothetical protein
MTTRVVRRSPSTESRELRRNAWLLMDKCQPQTASDLPIPLCLGQRIFLLGRFIHNHLQVSQRPSQLDKAAVSAKLLLL